MRAQVTWQEPCNAVTILNTFSDCCLSSDSCLYRLSSPFITKPTLLLLPLYPHDIKGLEKLVHFIENIVCHAEDFVI